MRLTESDVFSLDLVGTVREWSPMAEKSYGQPPCHESVYPLAPVSLLGLCSQILPSVSWDSRGERSREEWQVWITERHTYLIYCMWPDCRVFGFTLIQPFAAVVFHHLPPGTTSADTITEAVNTFWCELYTNNTCRAVEILPPLLGCNKKKYFS